MTKQITSAFGEAKYPPLNQPDTAFNSDGIFQVIIFYKCLNIESQL